MINSNLSIVGAVVFWRVGERTDRKHLLANWKAAGLEKFVPDERPHTAALKDALSAVYQRRRGTFRVERLDKEDCFEVVEITRGAFKTGNTYTCTLQAKMEADSLNIKFFPLTPGCQEIVDEFNKQLGLLAQAQVSAALVAVAKSLGATVLRPTGGVYWLPEAKLDEWRAAADGVEQAGNNAVYLLRSLKDVDAVRAVKDAVVAECTADAKRLEHEIGQLIASSAEIESEGGRKRREATIKRRREEFAAILQKLADYEEALGVGLEGVRESVGRCELVAMQATLLDSGVPEEVGV